MVRLQHHSPCAAIAMHAQPRADAVLPFNSKIKHDDDFYGRTVVIAARISELAIGGEVLASDLVYALARGLGTFTFGDPRTAQLKGLDGSFDLHPVLGCGNRFGSVAAELDRQHFGRTRPTSDIRAVGPVASTRDNLPR
jgi:hypothetical protein